MIRVLSGLCLVFFLFSCSDVPKFEHYGVFLQSKGEPVELKGFDFETSTYRFIGSDIRNTVTVEVNESGTVKLWVFDISKEGDFSLIKDLKENKIEYACCSDCSYLYTSQKQACKQVDLVEKPIKKDGYRLFEANINPGIYSFMKNDKKTGYVFNYVIPLSEKDKQAIRDRVEIINNITSKKITVSKEVVDKLMYFEDEKGATDLDVKRQAINLERFGKSWNILDIIPISSEKETNKAYAKIEYISISENKSIMFGSFCKRGDNWYLDCNLKHVESDCNLLKEELDKTGRDVISAIAQYYSNPKNNDTPTFDKLQKAYKISTPFEVAVKYLKEHRIEITVFNNRKNCSKVKNWVRVI